MAASLFTTFITLLLCATSLDSPSLSVVCYILTTEEYHIM